MNLEQHNLSSIPFEFSSFVFLFSKKWWSQNFDIWKSSWKNFLVPTLILCFANLLFALILSQMSVCHNTEFELGKLLFSLFLILLGAAIGLVLCLWSLTIWLQKLTAFSSYSLKIAKSKSCSFLEELQQVRQNTLFFTKFWLYASLVLLLPIIFLSLFIVLGVLSSTELSSLYPGLYVDIIRIPLAYKPVIILFEIIFFVINISLCLIFTLVSASLNFSPREAVLKSLKIYGNNFLFFSFLTLFIIVVNLIVGSPYIFLFWTSLYEKFVQNIYLNLLAQIWSSLTAILLWPFSLLVILEKIKSYL